MEHLTPHTLPAVSQGFLSAPEIDICGGKVIVRARFDLSAFDPSLFANLGIKRPETLRSAIPKRLAEFLAGRTLARLAQEALGHRATQIAIGADRAPIWPAQLSGSISHARGYCACIAQDAALGHLGIDIDLVTQNQALEAVLRLVVNADERAVLDAAPLPLNLGATLVFSAKETLFKALFPVVQRHFGFPAAALRTPPANGRLRLYLTEDLHPTLPADTYFDVTYDSDADHVCTWLVHSRA